MANILSSLSNFFSVFRINDIIDIIVVAYLFYKLATLVRETRAQQLIKGVILLFAIMWVSNWLQLNTLNYILTNAMQVGLIAILIVFQPELRRALEKVGRTKLSTFIGVDTEDVSVISNEVSKAAGIMSGEHIGALIVLERHTKVGDILRTGTELNAEISAELLINIFVPNTPLHDGAVIIRDSKIAAAGCLLPLTQNEFLSRELGTRHRAALGISETSDALVVIVSEETGKISIAMEGNLTRNLTVETLKKAIDKHMNYDNESKQHDRISTWKGKLQWKK